MIGAGAIGALPIAALSQAGVVYFSGAQVAGAGFVAATPRASLRVAGSSLGGAILVSASRRARALDASSLGQATIALDYRRRVGVAAGVAGHAAVTARFQLALLAAASVTGRATIRLDPEARFYAATREFITRPDDSPSNQPLHGTVQKALRLDRTIIGGNGFGQVTATWGYIELINAEGDYDNLIDRYAVDGRRVRVRAGVAGQPYGSFVTLFDGTAKNWHVAEDVLRIEIRDNTFLIEVPASPSLYAGTGGVEGGTDLKGKRRPRALGELGNVTPPLVIPSLLSYQFNAGAVEAIPAVYDRGVALTPAGDFATVALLNAALTGASGSGAAIEAGEFATCLADGWFRLGGSPVGQITCDVRGDKAGGVYASTTAAIVRRLLAGVPSTIALVEPSFGAVEAVQPAVVGYWLDTGAETSVADIVADLMAGIGGWGGFRRGGAFEVGIFTAPAAPPAGRYDRVDVLDIERQPLPEGLSPPPYRFRLAWGRNWTVQTDAEGGSGITAARVAWLAEAYRLAASNDAVAAQVRASHILAQDPDPVLAFFRDEAAALAEANRRLALHATTRSLYRVKLKAHPFVHEIGESVLLTYPRWDLKAGRLLRIVALSEDTDEGTTEIVGWG